MAERIIYQAFTRNWGTGKFSCWDSEAFRYLRSLGVTHLWLTGIPAHASGEDFVKGNPGSPYAVEDWYDTNPYLADKPERRMKEFEALVSRAHRKGIKIITDFIPNHVARNYKGDIPRHDWCDYDWTDTLKVDYYANGCWDKMLDVLLFWASKGVDGVRCDMVELVPPEFFAWATAKVREKHPDFLFIGEVYKRDNYNRYCKELGFDLIYDKSGLYDSLRAILLLPASTKNITWNWQRLGDLQTQMLNFLENHDEQRIASSAFLSDAMKAIPGMAVAALFNNASLLIYGGQEIGEDAREDEGGRSSIFDWTRKTDPLGKLDDAQKRILEEYRRLLDLSRTKPFCGGANWDLCYCNYDSPGFNADRHFAFLRFDWKHSSVVACNFTDERAVLKIRIPEEAGIGASIQDIEVDPWNYSVKKIK